MVLNVRLLFCVIVVFVSGGVMQGARLEITEGTALVPHGAAHGAMPVGMLPMPNNPYQERSGGCCQVLWAGIERCEHSCCDNECFRCNYIFDADAWDQQPCCSMPGRPWVEQAVWSNAKCNGCAVGYCMSLTCLTAMYICGRVLK